MAANRWPSIYSDHAFSPHQFPARPRGAGPTSGAATIPALKTRRVVFPMEPINSVDDIVEAYRGLWDACAQGILSPDETATLAGVLKDHAAVLEAKDLEARIARLEAAAVKFAGRGFGRGFGPGFWGYYGYDNGLWWNPDYGDYTYCY